MGKFKIWLEDFDSDLQKAARIAKRRIDMGKNRGDVIASVARDYKISQEDLGRAMNPRKTVKWKAPNIEWVLEKLKESWEYKRELLREGLTLAEGESRVRQHKGVEIFTPRISSKIIHDLGHNLDDGLDKSYPFVLEFSTGYFIVSGGHHLTINPEPEVKIRLANLSKPQGKQDSLF